MKTGNTNLQKSALPRVAPAASPSIPADPAVSEGAQRDLTTSQAVRPAGTFAPRADQLAKGGAVARTLLEQQDDGAPKRRGRGRTGDLRRLQTPRQTLVAQSRKPTVRAEHKRLLDLGPAITQALARFEQTSKG